MSSMSKVAFNGQRLIEKEKTSRRTSHRERETELVCWDQVTGGNCVNEVCLEDEMVDRDETGTSEWIKGGVRSMVSSFVRSAGLCSHAQVGLLTGVLISGQDWLQRGSSS